MGLAFINLSVCRSGVHLHVGLHFDAGQPIKTASASAAAAAATPSSAITRLRSQHAAWAMLDVVACQEEVTLTSRVCQQSVSGKSIRIYARLMAAFDSQMLQGVVVQDQIGLLLQVAETQ